MAPLIHFNKKGQCFAQICAEFRRYQPVLKCPSVLHHLQRIKTCHYSHDNVNHILILGYEDKKDGKQLTKEGRT